MVLAWNLSGVVVIAKCMVLDILSKWVDDILVIMRKATKIFKQKIDYPDGCIMDGVVWLLPEESVPGCQHLYKYRLYYGCEGRWDIGYDNERGKGDHRHYGEREEPYTFISFEQLINDFLADVAAYRTEANNSE